MKRLAVFFAAAILLSSFVYADEAIKNIDLSKSANMSISDRLDLIYLIIKSGGADKIEGQKLEGVLGKIFKNEIVNVHVDKPVEDIELFIETSGSVIKDIGIGKNDKPTINVYINLAKLEKIAQESKNSKEIIKSAFEQKAVKIQGVGAIKKMKLWFLIKIGKITGAI